MAGMLDSILMAQEYIVNDLISGKEFKGLGPTARILVIAVANDANENAKLTYGDKTVRTDDGFRALTKACQEQFVMDVLGFGREPFTPQQAAQRLVERVYEQYLDWAKVA